MHFGGEAARLLGASSPGEPGQGPLVLGAVYEGPRRCSSPQNKRWGQPTRPWAAATVTKGKAIPR